jgi:DNA-binding GntR family transcriptional regulator
VNSYAAPSAPDPRAYVQMAAVVRQQIAVGALQPGQPAPSITHLAREYGHARPTCSKALRLLEGEGLRIRIPASATT